MCVGKALTGGYLTLAATLCTAEVADGHLRRRESGVLMHGPTYMGNPLACAVALASLDLLSRPRLAGRRRPGSRPGSRGLAPLRASCPASPTCASLGAVGVVQLDHPVDVAGGHRGGARATACGCGRSAT